MQIDPLLKALVDRGGSDLHIQANDQAIIRASGSMTPITKSNLTPENTESVFNSITNETQRDEMIKNGSTDFAYSVEGYGRLRINAFRQKSHVAMVFRHIPSTIPSLEELGLPSILKEISENERGMVLVVGVTGSGKSTTLAAMLDNINSTMSKRIITIEDPVEFIHTSKKSMISQRELGRDAISFASALRGAMRQDPDVILVGELRDFETIRTAIRAAETGHLVFSTLHTSDAVQTVDRMIGYFPADERDMARQQVALNLKSVVAQRLIKTIEGGRTPALEILVNNSLSQKMLMNNKIKELHQVIQNGTDGMQTFDQALLALIKSETISEEESMKYSANPAALKRMIKGGMSDGDRGGIIAF